MRLAFDRALWALMASVRGRVAVGGGLLLYRGPGPRWKERDFRGGDGMNLLLVMLGGALGTGGRYLLGGWLNAQAASGFPWGTLGVNLLGSLAIGAVFGLARQGAVPPGALLFLTVGVLGGFTTFSTFSYETLRLLADGSPGASLLNAAVQLAGGLAAVYLGFVAARLLG